MTKEIAVPKERPGIVGYAHLFERYFELEGKTIDRVELVAQYGIVSERRAQELGIPYKRALNFSIMGVSDYNDIIFFFPIFDLNNVPAWGGNTAGVILAHDMPVISPQEMTQYQKGNWAQMSIVGGGEFYRFGQAEPEYIREIRLPHSSSDTDRQHIKSLSLKYHPNLPQPMKIN